MSLCTHCQNAPIPRGKRRYCATCSPIASRIWKARQRQQWASDWRSRGQVGSPPYLDAWPSRDEFRAYFRNYMRAWRRRRNTASSPRGDDSRISTQPGRGGSHA